MNKFWLPNLKSNSGQGNRKMTNTDEINEESTFVYQIRQHIQEIFELKQEEIDKIQRYLENMYKCMSWIDNLPEDLLIKYPIINKLMEIASIEIPYIQKLSLENIYKILKSTGIGLQQFSETDYVGFINYFMSNNNITVYRQISLILLMTLSDENMRKTLIENNFIANLINFADNKLDTNTLKDNEFSCRCLVALTQLFDDLEDEIFNEYFDQIVQIITKLFNIDFPEIEPFNRFLLSVISRKQEDILFNTDIFRILIEYFSNNSTVCNRVILSCSCLSALVQGNIIIPQKYIDIFDPRIFIDSLSHFYRNRDAPIYIYSFLNSFIAKIPKLVMDEFLNEKVIAIVSNNYENMNAETKLEMLTFLWAVVRFMPINDKIQILDIPVFELMLEILQFDSERVALVMSTHISYFVDHVKRNFNVDESAGFTKLIEALEYCLDSPIETIQREAETLLTFCTANIQNDD
ncbi:hypothetical protein TVAG_447260 [Trichomonas vaginalis G3]|uniref:Uncharacterized protein n=1 Tax=Trichomonas vaginalis (strain ATCC PRA-98 / G3) TaxID=412133 RepID=A2DRZ8_TRIV3|nr:armadillo (ARM) repeat-containing protein family [Trichomonas vaginalis G3]EAY16768.1 hypothetical protein TVAG_447260 [Trichomonas vaginalis G3]KAI5490825.1 armadillo (ARM) repeat-containing protein family [Trichomonas vaginalis G3]|eukprot:XP_001328991.1 hypothetical protein [Trichomonas vaginalis G3]